MRSSDRLQGLRRACGEDEDTALVGTSHGVYFGLCHHGPMACYSQLGTSKESRGQRTATRCTTRTAWRRVAGAFWGLADADRSGHASLQRARPHRLAAPTGDLSRACGPTTTAISGDALSDTYDVVMHDTALGRHVLAGHRGLTLEPRAIGKQSLDHEDAPRSA